MKTKENRYRQARARSNSRRRMVSFQTGDQKLRALGETGWNVFERRTHDIWNKITQPGNQEINIDWKNGGHGPQCSCKTCREDFSPENTEMEGYEKLARRMFHENEPRFHSPLTVHYRLQSIPENRDLKNLETRFKGSLIRLQQWMKDNYLYCQLNTNGYFGSVPKIKRIIFDETDLFTETAATEYYHHIHNQHPKRRQPENQEGIPRSEFSLDDTMVVDLRGFYPMGETHNFIGDRKAIKNILDVFGSYHRVRTGEDIPVYIIYGEKEFTRVSTKEAAKEAVENTWRFLHDWALAPAEITWLGPGFGLADMPNHKKEAYMMMSHYMAKKSMDTINKGLKLFNAFIHKNVYSADAAIKKKQQEGLRETFYPYFQTGDPMKLPTVMRPGKPISITIQKGQEQSPQKCSDCQQAGHAPTEGGKECLRCKVHDRMEKEKAQLAAPTQDEQIRGLLALLHIVTTLDDDKDEE